MKSIFFIAFSVGVLGAQLPKPSQYYVPYSQSMMREKFTWGCWTNEDKRWHRIFPAIYMRNNLSNAVACKQARIPKIIHQIWLGGPLPEKYKKWQESWQKHHPDWEYRLWTDAEVDAFFMKNRAHFDAVTQLGAKADIWRYEILYRYGGLYVDMDFECLQPFDVLHHCYNFFTGIENSYYYHLANGLIACKPSHGVIRRCVEAIGKLIPQEFTDVEVIQSTGPICLSKAFATYMSRTSDMHTIAMPHSYFYPVPWYEREQYTLEDFVRPESFAVHHWAGEWMNEEDYNEA